MSNVKEVVSKIYDDLATANCNAESSGPDVTYTMQLGYNDEEAEEVPQGSNLGLGCGNPNAIANIKLGETVLDLGCGAGFDCFLAAKKVGITGKVVGVDMIPSMIEKAKKNAVKAIFRNVDFRLGEIENLPVEENTVDVILSNCVINLSANKEKVFSEAFRVLKTGGRLAIADLVATKPLPLHVKQEFEVNAGCVAGILSIDQLQGVLEKVGFRKVNIKLRETCRSFIEKWTSCGSNAENYVASAQVEAYKLCFG